MPSLPHCWTAAEAASALQGVWERRFEERVAAKGAPVVGGVSRFAKQGAANTGLGRGTGGTEGFGLAKSITLARLPICDEPSRKVNGGSLQRHSINFNTDV